jgi:hypothetical protein
VLRWVLIVFLIAHGVVHINVWVSKIMASQGTNPSHSWLLGDQRTVATGLAVAAASLFALAGAGLLFRTGWWGPATVIAAGVSLMLTALFPDPFKPSPWLIAPVAIDLGLIAGVVWFSWPTRAVFGG